jgi:hypothetical protein
MTNAFGPTNYYYSSNEGLHLSALSVQGLNPKNDSQKWDDSNEVLYACMCPVFLFEQMSVSIFYWEYVQYYMFCMGNWWDPMPGHL